MKKHNWKVFFGITLMAVIIGIACTTQAGPAKLNMSFKEAPRAGVVAKIGNEEITEDILINRNKGEFMKLKQQEYEVKMEMLKQLIEERLMSNEAKKAGMSKDEFLQKKVIGGDIKVSEADIAKLIKEKNLDQQVKSNPGLRDRISEYLKMQQKDDKVQSYLAKLTKSNPIEVYFQQPMVTVEVGEHTPTMGNKDAKVTIVEFSDFQCPYCSKAAATVAELKKKYGNKIRVAFRHFPLPFHQEATPAAEASLCANEQSADKFWKYHDLMFKNQQKLDAASLNNYAKEAGLNVEQFKSCFQSKKYAEQVKMDTEYGKKIGVQSTPTFFVNGVMIAGALPAEAFSEKIDAALEK